jgi:hypothetical protein
LSLGGESRFRDIFSGLIVRDAPAHHVGRTENTDAVDAGWFFLRVRLVAHAPFVGGIGDTFVGDARGGGHFDAEVVVALVVHGLAPRHEVVLGLLLVEGLEFRVETVDLDEVFIVTALHFRGIGGVEAGIFNGAQDGHKAGRHMALDFGQKQHQDDHAGAEVGGGDGPEFVGSRLCGACLCGAADLPLIAADDDGGGGEDSQDDHNLQHRFERPVLPLEQRGLPLGHGAGGPQRPEQGDGEEGGDGFRGEDGGQFRAVGGGFGHKLFGGPGFVPDAYGDQHAEYEPENDIGDGEEGGAADPEPLVGVERPGGEKGDERGEHHPAGISELPEPKIQRVEKTFMMKSFQ